MNAQIWMFFLLITSVHSIYAQIDERFNNNDLLISDDWSGDLSLFVNDDNRLRLIDDAAGSAILIHPVEIGEQWEYEIDLELDFSPSSQNRFKWTLWSDESVGELHLMIGETGSDDAIEIWQRIGSENVLLARGMDGLVSEDPVCINLSVVKMESSLAVDVTTCEGVTDQIEAVWDERLNGIGLIGLECTYTNSRADRFWFDNIYAGPIRVDESPPRLIDLDVNIDQTILRFDEIISTPISSNFILNNEVGDPVDIVHEGSEVTLFWSPILETDTDYLLDIIGVSDERDNLLDTVVSFIVLAPITDNDLLINEVLFDPFNFGSDFIELINVSDEALDLNGLQIVNQTNGQQELIDTTIIVEPNSIVALTNDSEDIISQYPTHRSENIIEIDIPDMANSSGDILLLFEGEVIDRLMYEEDMHHFLYDDTEGVSLERISTNITIDGPDNWTSASESVGFATPGLANSTRLSNAKNEISISTKVVSPNGDAIDDALVVNYNFDSPNYVASVSIYTDRGHHVVDLVNNKTIGASGVLTWDARLESGQSADQGIYVFVIKVFNEFSNDVLRESFAISKLNN